jgi:2-hydroxychromene-2-carboxylate isomerase
MPEHTITALHFTDPACPWAYSSRPANARLVWRFGDQIEWRLVMIGLREDAATAVARGYTPARSAAGNRSFKHRFGMPFQMAVKERPSGTGPACRAIIAVRDSDQALGDVALRALQLMQFTTTGLLDDADDIAAAFARFPEIDGAGAAARIDDPDVVAAYRADKARTRSADGSPTHVQNRHSTSDGPVRYTAPSVIFEHLDGRSAEVGGFQPFESYDNALANLEPGLDRRAAPDDVAEALSAFPHGLTTAEVASVMRPTDLAAPDQRAAETALIALVGEGGATCEPFGDDALWRPA